MIMGRYLFIYNSLKSVSRHEYIHYFLMAAFRARRNVSVKKIAERTSILNMPIYGLYPLENPHAALAALLNAFKIAPSKYSASKSGSPFSSRTGTAIETAILRPLFMR